MIKVEEKEFIALIKKRRESKLIMQKDLAKIIPMSSSSYSKLENGNLKLNYFLIRRLAEIFELDLNIIKVKKYNKYPNID